MIGLVIKLFVGLFLLWTVALMISSYSKVSEESAANEAAHQAASAPPAWVYSNSGDQAQIASGNTVHFAYPYNGDSRGSLVFRQDATAGLAVLLSISKGKFVCETAAHCSVKVRFDSGQEVVYAATDAMIGNTDTLVLSDAERFLSEARKARLVYISAEFERDEGARTLEFAVASLMWPPQKP